MKGLSKNWAWLRMAAAVMVLLFNNISLRAQNQYNNWCFGSLAGLDFNYGEPLPLPDIALSTTEGSASISDKYGRLLFYTNGEKVWNRHHSIMSAGSGLFGNFSTTQTLILPLPGDSLVYFIFTADAQGGPKGLRYSTVDLSLEGGLGAVVAKNVQLNTPVTEKITAVKHANGKDYWIVAHEWESDRFLVYALTASGFDKVPITSAVGISHQGGFMKMNSLGAIKANRKGNMLAAALVDENVVDLLNFDNTSGKVTHKALLQFDPLQGPYGLEFSRSGKFLYVSLFNSSRICQLDVSRNTTAEILSSTDTLYQNFKDTYGALQIAPDGKIYIANLSKNYLSAITFPDKPGKSCAFKREAALLGGRSSSLGLPNYIPEYLSGFNFKHICLGQTTLFSINDTSGIDSVRWDFGEPGSGAANTSTLLDPQHAYISARAYLVRLTIFSAGQASSSFTYVNIEAPPQFDLGNDTVICSQGELALNVEMAGCHYSWHNSSTKPLFNVKTSGRYWVKVSNGCGIKTDTINVTFSSEPVLDLGPDSVFCDRVFFLLEMHSPHTNYQWSNGSDDSSLLIEKAGTYHVKAFNQCGEKSDTLNVTLRRCDLASVLTVPNVFTPDGDSINDRFEFLHKNIEQFYIEIYNRWAQKIFVSENISHTWDGMSAGKLIPEGTYFYFLQARGADQQIYELRGSVSVLYSIPE